MQKRIQQLRSDYEKAEELAKKYKVINEQLKNKIRKMKVYILFYLFSPLSFFSLLLFFPSFSLFSLIIIYYIIQNDYDELFIAANQNNKVPDANKLSKRTIKILADSNQHYKDIIQKKIEVRENQNKELSKTMRLMLKNDYEQKIKLKNEELEKSRKDTEMSQLQYELDNLNNRNKRFNTNTNYNENNEDQLFEKIIDKSKEIEIETQKRQNDKVIKQIMNNTYNSLKTYDLEDVDKSM